MASADPHRAPLIDPAYLADERDADRMIAGLRAAREIGATDPLAPIRDQELYPGPAHQTRPPAVTTCRTA